jgi:uncharacterized protein YkwD
MKFFSLFGIALVLVAEAASAAHVYKNQHFRRNAIGKLRLDSIENRGRYDTVPPAGYNKHHARSTPNKRRCPSKPLSSASTSTPIANTDIPNPTSSKALVTTSVIEIRTSSATHHRPTSTSSLVPATTPKPTTVTSTKASIPTSTTSQTSSGGSNGSGATDSDVTAYLKAHNDVRAQHNASPLTWSNEAAAKAQEWANKCVFKHSGGSLGPYGENLVRDLRSI